LRNRSRSITNARRLAPWILALSPAVVLADEVVLVDGGRVRGAVIEESPTNGVRVLLDDGTTYTVPAPQVKEVHYDGAATGRTAPPGAPASTVANGRATSGPMGTIVLRIGAGSGRVTVTDVNSPLAVEQPRGRIVAGTPVTLELAEGPWVVEVEFADGGVDSASVYAEPNVRAEVQLESWVPSHKGVHLGFVGHLQAGLLGLFAIGPHLAVFANLNPVSWCDLRLGGAAAFLGFPDPDSRTKVGRAELSAFAHVVFNVPGGVYRPYVGVNAGAYLGDFVFERFNYFPDESAPAMPKVEFDLSVLHFNFGAKRQFDLDFAGSGGVLIHPLDGSFAGPVAMGRVGFGGSLY
jgi:hypothetical protein